MNDKRDKYLELVAARKTCDLCDGLENPSRCAGGKYDSSEIGVWSGWQGGLDALVMIVGQDWGGVRNFQLQHGVDIASATIKMLCELLMLAGLKAELPSGQTQRGELFCTNAVLCLKHGGDQGKLRPEWIENCSQHFLRQQIEIIKPKLIVCLGQVAYEAVLGAYGLPCGQFRDAVERKVPLELFGGTKTVAVYHCGRRILNTHRKLEAQQRDWQRVGAIVQKLRSEHAGATVATTSLGDPKMEIPEEAFLKDKQPATTESQAKDIPTSQPEKMSNQLPTMNTPGHAIGALSVPQLTAERNDELNLAYHSFVRVVLDRKILREVKAKELIMGSLGKMSHEQFDDFFNLVDDDPTGPWFGPTLNVPNRALIRACPIDQLNELVANIVSTQSMKSLGEWRKKGFKGLSYGVASLILYIYEPTKYYVWLKKNHKGLQVLGRISFSYPSNTIAPESMDNLYSQFNANVISWREELSLHERSVDWVLWAACELLNNPNNKYLRAYITGSVK